MSRNVYLIVFAGLAICLFLEIFFPDHHHVLYPWHEWWWFDIVYGFVGCVAIVFISKAIGKSLLWKVTYSLPLLESDVGYGAKGATVKKWFVAEGQTVNENQPLVELETDTKKIITASATRPGKVLRLFLDPEESLRVGETLVDLQVSKKEVKAIMAHLEDADA